MRHRRILLTVLLALVLLVYGRLAAELWLRTASPENYAAEPVFVQNPQQEVRWLSASAERVGLQRGDRVVALNGKPYQGLLDMIVEVRNARPGDLLLLTIERSGERKDFSLKLSSLDRAAELRLSLIFLFTVVLLCLVLGFGVAFLRPLDVRSWILLGAMLSFAPLFCFIDVTPLNWLMRQLDHVLREGLQSTWTLWMGLLGFYFPDRFPAKRWLKWIFAFSVTVLLTHSAVVNLLNYGRMENLALARAVLPLLQLISRPAMALGMVVMGGYFALLGMRWGMARTADTKRRVVLLNFGSHLAFLPMFVLVIRSIIEHREIFDSVPGPVILFVMVMMALFPITLAYVIIVHRALELRVVLRTGLQYALAQRGVRLLQAAVTAGAVYWAIQVAEKGANRPRILTLVMAVVTLSLLSQRAAERLRKWVDQRFFREAYDSERILSELTREVRTIVETRPLIETVSRRIAESLHIDQIVALLRNESTFEPAYSLGYGAPVQTHFHAQHGLAARLEEKRAPLTVYLDQDESWANRELESKDREQLAELRTQVLLPLGGNDSLLGFLSLGAKRSEEPYTRNDLRLLESVAAQAGMALENARLTSAVASEAALRERSRREMEIARDVQQRLFPQKHPVVEGLEYAGDCRPALSVGGDSYDFLELPSGEFGIAVGDVSGKGVPAAILMAVLQTSIRAQTTASPDLAPMISHVSRLVDQSSVKSHFATLFYAQYHPQSRVLRYVNAGHNPPFLFRADGECQLLKPTGPAVGWYKKAVFHEARVQLEPGDVLIAYTDGFTEAMTKDREEFGDTRLEEAARMCHHLHAEAMVPAMMDAVDRFTAGEPQHDDMTMVVLKVMWGEIGI